MDLGGLDWCRTSSLFSERALILTTLFLTDKSIIPITFVRRGFSSTADNCDLVMSALLRIDMLSQDFCCWSL